MNKTGLLSFLMLSVMCAGHAQDQEKYSMLVTEAKGLYHEKAYAESAQKYAEAFVALGNRGMINDRYNAACSWALAGEVDSAFVQLFKITLSGSYTNYSHLTSDTDLITLHDDGRWKEILERVLANKEKSEAHLDRPLVALLDTVMEEDQKYRLQMSAIEEKYGIHSTEMNELIHLMIEKDSINLVRVTHILDTRGWLGADVIGARGNQALFLVIQHAELETQLKYLPMMREAVRKGNATAGSLALLEDRVALRTGGHQVYGSQIGRDTDSGQHYVLPLTDPMNVDARRAEVGLGKLQDYVSRWGITWDPEAYVVQLPELERRHAAQKQ